MQPLALERLRGKTLTIFEKEKNTVELVSPLSGFSSTPVPLSSISLTKAYTQWEISTKQTTHKNLAWATI